MQYAYELTACLNTQQILSRVRETAAGWVSYMLLCWLMLIVSC